MNVKLETLIRKIDEGNIIYTDEESYNKLLEELKDDEENLKKVKARVIVKKKEEEKEDNNKVHLNDKQEIKPNRRERRRRERALNKFIKKNKLKF